VVAIHVEQTACPALTTESTLHVTVRPWAICLAVAVCASQRGGFPGRSAL